MSKIQGRKKSRISMHDLKKEEGVRLALEARRRAEEEDLGLKSE